MRTRLLNSIALVLAPLAASAAPLGPPVNVTANPPASVQQLPFLSLTGNSPFLVFNDDTTRAGLMVNGEPLAHPVALDTTILRDGGAASIGDQRFGVWLHDDWMYGQRFDAAGNMTGSPTYIAMVDSRHTMRLGVAASSEPVPRGMGGPVAYRGPSSTPAATSRGNNSEWPRGRRAVEPKSRQ